MPVFLRFALREMRGGLRGFQIFLACLAVGVAAIGGVGSVATAIKQGIESEGQSILGGDVDLRLTYRDAVPAELAYLKRSGTLSETKEMRAMARNPANAARTLVELKAVDRNYPLYGAMELQAGGPIGTALALQSGQWGAVVESPLARRLNLAAGDRLIVGDQEYIVRDIIAREPDRVAGGMALGPRVMIATQSLESTGLVQAGSLISRHYRVKLPAETPLREWIAATTARFPTTEWRIRTRENGAPGMRQFVDRLGLFLTLVGLTALVVGGVGVGNSVRGYLERKRETIATLKCLGTPSATIFRTYLAQIVMLACIGIVIGLIIGAATPMLLETALADRLPVRVRFAVYPQPLIEAAIFGVVTALAFAIWPLARSREVAAGSLFRDLVAPERQWPRARYISMTLALVALLALLAFAIAEDRRFATWFVLGVAGSFALLRTMAAGIVALAKRLPRPHNPGLRLALANLHRPGTPTPVVILSLGLGLTLLVTIALVEGNITRQVETRVPREAPAFFFLDIPPTEKERFTAVATMVNGVSDVDLMPNLRARITRLDDRPAIASEAPAEARWVLRGDRVVTYTAHQPENATLTAGTWWPADYNGPPLLSFDSRLGEALGLGVGDTLTVNILGREITATIANLRVVEWSNMAINFAMIFSPGLISTAPHTYVGTARAEGDAEKRLHVAVTDAFPGVSTVRVKEALETVNGILTDLANAVRAAAGVTLVSGVLVLAGAMAAGHGQRVYDAVMLKVLGATRRRILTAYILEYALLGVCAAALAGVAGTVISYAVVTNLMQAEWVFLPLTVLLTILFSTALTVSLGLAATWRALGRKAAPVLRAA